MKTKIGLALGLAIGNALYQLTRPDSGRLDWADVVVVPLICFALLLLVPNRWLEKKKGTDA